MKKIYLLSILFPIFISLSFAQEAIRLFPNDNESKGWVKSGKSRVFSGEKLWEYIDGAAETYYPFGFKKVITQDYKNGDRQIVVDIYEFKDAKNTFGIYSFERDDKYNFLKIGVQGYLERNSLNFWKGNYYIKMVSFSKKNIKDDLTSLAKIIEKKISGKYSEPEIIKYFPQKNLLINSIKYFVKDLLGHSFFNNGYIAEYQEGKEKYQVFILDAGNLQNAKKYYMSYKNYVAQTKNLEKDIANVGMAAFSGKAVRKKVFAFYNSKIMAGVININGEENAIKILNEMNNK